MSPSQRRFTPAWRAARLLSAGLTALAVLVGAAQAHEYYAAGLTFVHPWADASALGATDAAVYFELANVRHDDRLISATSRLAERIELRAGDDDAAPPLLAIAISAADELVFGPGRPHLLLRGLVAPLQWGRSYGMRVVFEKAGALDVQISIGAH